MICYLHLEKLNVTNDEDDDSEDDDDYSKLNNTRTQQGNLNTHGSWYSSIPRAFHLSDGSSFFFFCAFCFCPLSLESSSVFCLERSGR